MFVALWLIVALVRGLSYAGTTAHQSDDVASSSTEVARAMTTGSPLANSALVSVEHSIRPQNMTETPVHAWYFTVSVYHCGFLNLFHNVPLIYYL